MSEKLKWKCPDCDSSWVWEAEEGEGEGGIARPGCKGKRYFSEYCGGFGPCDLCHGVGYLGKDPIPDTVGLAIAKLWAARVPCRACGVVPSVESKRIYGDWIVTVGCRNTACTVNPRLTLSSNLGRREALSAIKSWNAWQAKGTGESK